MTQQEARQIIEATTPFEVRGGRVWLREPRWLRAVQQLRAEEAASLGRLPESAEVAFVVGRRPPHGHAHSERRAVPVPVT